MTLALENGKWSECEVRWTYRRNYDEVFFDDPPDDARGDFTRAVHSIRAFSPVLVDGDHAIKSRVFSFLFKRQWPWYWLVKEHDAYMLAREFNIPIEQAAGEINRYEGNFKSVLVLRHALDMF